VKGEEGGGVEALDAVLLFVSLARFGNCKMQLPDMWSAAQPDPSASGA
jgi:hypothetical protein